MTFSLRVKPTARVSSHQIHTRQRRSENNPITCDGKYESFAEAEGEWNDSMQSSYNSWPPLTLFALKTNKLAYLSIRPFAKRFVVSTNTLL
jgi:hypothetical protein